VSRLAPPGSGLPPPGPAEILNRVAPKWHRYSLRLGTPIPAAPYSCVSARIPSTPRSGELKFSEDPQFVEKVREIVGLYVTPTDRAIVLCVEEPSAGTESDRTDHAAARRPS
jgi:hypothetical protein